MPEENVAIVREFFDAFNRRDWDAAVELGDPQGEFHWHDQRALPDVRQHVRGPAKVIEFWERLLDVWEDYRCEPLEFVEAPGGRVVFLARNTGRARESGVPMTFHAFLVCTLRAGRIHRTELFRHRADALEAAGVQDQAPMSGGNVKLARQLVHAFNRRDLAAMTRSFDPEVEWRPGGPAAVERAVYRDRDEVSSGFAATWEAWEVFHLEESEIRDLGDSILWLGRARMRGGASHVELDQEFAIHLVMGGGKVVRIRGFVAWQEALESAGLRE